MGSVRIIIEKSGCLWSEVIASVMLTICRVQLNCVSM